MELWATEYMEKVAAGRGNVSYHAMNALGSAASGVASLGSAAIGRLGGMFAGKPLGAAIPAPIAAPPVAKPAAPPSLMPRPPSALDAELAAAKARQLGGAKPTSSLDDVRARMMAKGQAQAPSNINTGIRF